MRPKESQSTIDKGYRLMVIGSGKDEQNDNSR